MVPIFVLEVHIVIKTPVLRGKHRGRTMDKQWRCPHHFLSNALLVYDLFLSAYPPELVSGNLSPEQVSTG